MYESDIKPGYVYHIKDSYFDTVKDDKLMRNYEGGAYRPTYFCVKDEKTGLFWVIGDKPQFPRNITFAPKRR